MGYHIVNIGIHIINALLVYCLVLLSFRSLGVKGAGDEGRFAGWGALLCSLLFVSHPVQTQAVTYIVQRFASLATLFYLLSLVMYIKWRLQLEAGHSKLRAWMFYVFSLLCAVCAMKTKETAFTLPVVIALYEFMFFRGKVLKRIVFLLPLLATMLIIPFSLIGIDRPLGEMIGDVTEATRVQTSMPRWDYLFTEFRVIVTYLRLIFFPVGQNLDYDYPVYRSFFDPNVFLSFLFLLFVLGLGIYALYRSRRASSVEGFTPCALRLTAFGIFWFFITLSVESSIIPIQDVIFEHRVYLPSVGAFLAITASVFMATERLRARGNAAWKGTAVALCLIIVVLAGAAYTRNSVWRDDLSLWSDVVAKSPNKARGYNNLGIAYQKRNEMSEAMQMYKKAATLIPPFIDAFYNLGFVHFSFNQYDRGYYNLGVYYSLKGRYEDALGNYAKALTANPGFAEAYNSRGILYASTGRYDDAFSDYTKAIQADPKSAGAYNNRGVLYAGRGRYADALEDLDKALSLDPNYADAYYNRGVVLGRSARLDSALSDLRKACALGRKEGCDALKNVTPSHDR
jgi:tetratricopeptide (TPR) repeat protein